MDFPIEFHSEIRGKIHAIRAFPQAVFRSGEIGQYLFGMDRNIGVFIDPFDPAVRSDQNGQARCPLLVRRFRRAVCHCDRAVGIAQQIRLVTGLVCPFFQIFGGAERNTDQCAVFIENVLGSITEPFSFPRSITAEGAREKPDKDAFAGEVVETDGFAVLVRQGEAGRFAARFE